MSEPIITQESVAAAYQELQAKGIKPSTRKIRQHLGGGSHADIHRFLKPIADQVFCLQEEVLDLPKEVSAVILAAGRKMYAASEAVAMARIQAIERDSKAIQKQLEAERDELEQELVEVEAERDALSKAMEAENLSRRAAEIAAERAAAAAQEKDQLIAEIRDELRWTRESAQAECAHLRALIPKPALAEFATK